MSIVEKFLERLVVKRRVRVRGHVEYACICPAHADRVPSLYVREGSDGRVVMKCFAGCSNRDICSVLGLELKDLFPERPKRPVSEEGAEQSAKQGAKQGAEQSAEQDWVSYYAYRNYEGKHCFTKVVKRKADGSKDVWITPAGGKVPCLYREDEVVEGVAAGRTIWITEGENDANVMRDAYGVIATTAGGANEWRSEYARFFVGATVHIVMDKKNGEGYARDVYLSLRKVAKGIRVFVAAGGRENLAINDPYDHLKAGYLLEDFEEVDFSPLISPEGFNWLSSLKEKEVRWLWYPWLPLGYVSLLNGYPGTGKSYFSCVLASYISSGRPLFGIDSSDAPHGTVLILDLEDDAEETIVPRVKRLGGNPDMIAVYKKPILAHEVGQVLEFMRNENGDAPLLVVIDPLYRYIGERVDIYKVNVVQQVFGKLAATAQEYNTCILGILHPPKLFSFADSPGKEGSKKGRRPEIEKFGGSLGGVVGSVRSAMTMFIDELVPSIRHIRLVKSNYAGEHIGKTVSYSLKDGVFSWVDPDSLNSLDSLSGDYSYD